MAKIEASDSRTFRVNAPIEEVYPIFADVETIAGMLEDLERWEQVDDNTARWVIKSKTEKGITFQPDYTVRYDGNGTDKVTWKTIKGNLETSGTVTLKKISDETTQISYRETLIPDLPIPRLMARVFKPIVSREVKKGIGARLDKIEAQFR